MTRAVSKLGSIVKLLGLSEEFTHTLEEKAVSMELLVEYDGCIPQNMKS